MSELELKENPEIAGWRDDKTADEEMVKDIKQHGQLNKILARKLPSGELEIIHGHRRLNGCSKAGRKPEVEVRENVSDVDALYMAISENLVRKELSPVEEGRALASLREHKVSVKDIAKRVQRSESFVRTRLALLDLPKAILTKISEGKLPMFSAVHLRKLQHLPEAQKEVAIDFASSVRHRYSNTEEDLVRKVEGVLEEAKKREELVAKYGACPNCGSKRIKEDWSKERLKCKDCGHEYDAETKDPWELVEMKKQAKDLGMDLTVVDGKGVVMTATDVREHLAELEKAKEPQVGRDFRTQYPLETWVNSLLKKENNIKRIEVSDDKVNIVLIEGTDLRFRAHSKNYKTGEKGKVTVEKPWTEDGEDTLAKRREAVENFEKTMVAKA